MVLDFDTPVLPRVYQAIQNLDVVELAKCSGREIRPILPCLSRISLLPPIDNNKKSVDERKKILTLLAGIETVNSIVALLSIDFHALEVDVKREQQIRQKTTTNAPPQESILVPSIQGGIALEFERSDSTRSIRLVLHELFSVAAQIPDKKEQLRSSELFDHPVYLEKVADVLCVALAELPAQLNASDVAENLLHVRHGPWLICRIVANAPDTFKDVCTSLIANGEKQEEDGLSSRSRMKALSMLCQMNPGQALAVRAKCVELCRMPALAVLLSLKHPQHPSSKVGAENDDVVAFVSGLLLGSDQQVRNWFAMFVRNGQKRRLESHAALQALRAELVRRLRSVLNQNSDGDKMEVDSEELTLPGEIVTQASALLRLFCALRGIAAIKFQEEEVALIVRLVTSHPPPSPAGVHFVSLGLCMLIACPTLVLVQEHERRSVEYVKWLVREEAYFESASGVTASFGEMLLLMAIHFHSNQLSAVCDLVCATLGMKIPIRHQSLSRIKTIFVQEIFTEQVVTAHAVKVLVTPQLNANMQGYLPVHCIHQLLKSRAFSKHRVPIKDWIYRQICASEFPLHPVLPALIEVYVSSILVPATKQLTGPDGTIQAAHTNEPISEEEIRKVFQTSTFQQQQQAKFAPARVQGSRKSTEAEAPPSSLTPQLLLLYYVLHYEDLRLSSANHGFSHLARPAKAYASDFLADLPIKYLLQQAQKHQQHFGGLFSPLLRLLATHFPHLSLVDDWFGPEQVVAPKLATQNSGAAATTPLTKQDIDTAFSELKEFPLRTSLVLERLAAMPPTEAWPHAETITSHFKAVLGDTVPQHLQELYQSVWLRLNTVLPRCLWVMTINALMTPDPQPGMDSLFSQHNTPLIPLTQEDIVMDPLQVLRCDERVFRCAPALSIVLRVLQASLAASRSQLARQLQDRMVGGSGPAPPLHEMKEREDLRIALVAAQESAAVQILLETCLETQQDKEKPGQQWALRECRGVICSHLHQAFIAETSLAKLVHFQGYPMELLPMTVRGIPSMHICLDFLPELLSQPAADKQVFAVNLASYLALQYALPKSFSVARLTVNTLSTLLSVLPSSGRSQFFSNTLPALARICEAFPALLDDVVSFLVQLGRVGMSQGSLDGHSCARGSCAPSESNCLCLEIQDTFRCIMDKAVLKSNVYSPTSNSKNHTIV